MKKIIINATNLHVGGGVQVAVSFFTELSKILNSTDLMRNIELHLLVSSKIDLSLQQQQVDLSNFTSYKIVDCYGLQSLYQKQIKILFKDADLIFTIFGPFYSFLKKPFRITGFAQAAIAYPQNTFSVTLPLLTRLKNRCVFKLKEYFFKRDNVLIVEAKHVQEALSKLKGFIHKHIEVVPNCYSSIYLHNNTFTPLFNKEPDCIYLGYLGRAYPHKNLNILQDVSDILLNKYKLKHQFVLSLTNREMDNLGFSSQENFYSVGELPVAECPDFFHTVDALVFPSLLECFSATPYEAMAMKKPVFGSDLPFTHDLCQEYVYYFNPLNSQSIAKVIYDAFQNRDIMDNKVSAAFEFVIHRPKAIERAHGYLDIITQYV